MASNQSTLSQTNTIPRRSRRLCERAIAARSGIRFGVELEFHKAAQREGRFRDARYSHIEELVYCHRDYRNMAAALDKAGLPGAFRLPRRYAEYTGPVLRRLRPRRDQVSVTADDDLCILRGYRGQGVYDCWTLRYESDCFPDAAVSGALGCHDDGGRLAMIPVELNTPVLDGDEWADGLPGVERAVGSLARVSRRRIHLNETHGLHLHVSEAGGLTLETAKRVLTLAYALEKHLLFFLCPPHRRRSAHATPLRLGLAVGPEPPPPPPPSADAVRREMESSLPPALLDDYERPMRRIWGAGSLGQLRRRLQVGRLGDALCVGVKSVSRSHAGLADGSRGGADGGQAPAYTVEFRHAPASFRIRFVKTWVGILLSLVAVSRLPAASYKLALERIRRVIGSRGRRRCSLPVARQLVQILHDSLQPLQGVHLLGLDPSGYWEERLAGYSVSGGLAADVDSEGLIKMD